MTSHFPLSTNIQFWSKHTPLLDLLNWHLPLSSNQGNFGIFLENFNNEINIVTYSFFLANAQSIYYSRMYNKSDRKSNSFSPTCTSDNETPTFSRILVGWHLIFHSRTSPPYYNSTRKCTPLKYKKRQKARFPIVIQTPTKVYFCERLRYERSFRMETV